MQVSILIYSSFITDHVQPTFIHFIRADNGEYAKLIQDEVISEFAVASVGFIKDINPDLVLLLSYNVKYWLFHIFDNKIGEGLRLLLIFLLFFLEFTNIYLVLEKKIL